MKKKIISLILLLTMISVAAFSLASCGGDEDPKDPESSTTYVNLNINPEISMTVDGAGKVISVIGENEDGKVLLFGEEGIEGADLESAIAKITDLAVKMGFLSESNTDIEALVSSTDSSVADELLSKVKSKITATAETSGLSVTVGSEGAYALLRDLEALKSENPDNALIQSLTVSKYKLALSASENGEMTFDAAIALDDSALIAQLKDTYSAVEEYQTEAYEEMKREAMAVYEKALNLALDTVYTQFYTQNAAAHFDTVYLGMIYQLYAMSAHSFEALADGLALVEKAENYELDEARVAAILSPLGLSDAELEKIKDKEGKITLSSVRAYTSVYLNSVEGSENFAEIKEDVEAALLATENEYKLHVQSLTLQYKPMIEEVVAYIEPVLASAKALLDNPLYAQILTEAEKAELLSAYDEGMAIIKAAVSEGGTLNEDGLRLAIAKMESGRAATLAKIQADLTADELAAIEMMKTELEATLQSQKATFEASLDTVAQSAKSHLQSLKDKYLSENEK